MTEYIWEQDRCIGAVTGNVWSRSARRKGQEGMETEEVKLGFRIHVMDKGDMSEVGIEWRIGTDVVLFESFCGKIKSIVQHSE